MRLLLRIVLIALAVFVGWRVGTDLGLLAGVAWDRAENNDFVSNALLTIPLGGVIGSVLMGLIAFRLTRPRTAVEPPG